MPEPEPRVDDTDAAPGMNTATPESEQPTLFSASDAPTTEAVIVADAAPAGADEWDEPVIDSPADVAVPDPEPADAFATGVLEIVSSLDEPASSAAVVPTETAVEVAAPEAPPAEAPGDEISPDGATVAAEAAVEPAEGSAAATTAEVVPAPVATAEAEAGPARARVPWWPFAVYLGLWLVGLGYAAYRLLQVPAGQALYEQLLYQYFMLGGLVLTALGPILIPFEWLLARHGVEDSQRGGLFARTAFWGALTTLLGVVLWWGTIIAIEYMRLGRFM